MAWATKAVPPVTVCFRLILAAKYCPAPLLIMALGIFLKKTLELSGIQQRHSSGEIKNMLRRSVISARVSPPVPEPALSIGRRGNIRTQKGNYRGCLMKKGSKKTKKTGYIILPAIPFGARITLISILILGGLGIQLLLSMILPGIIMVFAGSFFPCREHSLQS